MGVRTLLHDRATTGRHMPPFPVPVDDVLFVRHLAVPKVVFTHTKQVLPLQFYDMKRDVQILYLSRNTFQWDHKIQF